MHLGDHRLGQGGDRLHDIAAAREQVEEIGRAPVLGGARGLHLLQVMARAKGLARPRQHHCPDRAILGEALKFRAQGRQQIVRKRVQRPGAVQGEARHRPVILSQQN